MEEFCEGFTVLSQPSAPNVPIAEYVSVGFFTYLTFSSIVFVHGIGGDPQKTWSSTAEPRPELRV